MSLLNQQTKKKKKVEKSISKIILDLGCGQSKATLDSLLSTPLLQSTDNGNVIIKGVDYVQCGGVDIVHDLTKFPYPFKDESIDGIFSSHFVEHLGGFDRAKFMDECYRILKPEGKMRLIHPYFQSARAYQDFTHAWPPITQTTYLYWDKNWREANKLTHGHYNLKCDFEFWIYVCFQDGTVMQKAEEVRTFWQDKYWNVIADLIVDLKKR